MPRHDCFEIDYSLGGPALFSNGGSLGWHKDEKKSGAWTNSCQEQFPITTSWWQLFSFFHSFFLQMAFQPPLKVKIRSRCRCPSWTLLIAVGFVFSSQFDTLNENVPEDFTIKHIAWILTKIFSVDCILVFFPPCLCTTLPGMPRNKYTSAAFKVSAFLLDVGHFWASVHKIKAVLV